MENNSVENKNDQLFEEIGKTRGIAITILDMFEQVLASHGLKIPDEYREGDEDEACIYGKTYFSLEDKICELLYEHIDE